MAKGKFDMSEFLTPVEGVPESGTTREIAVDDIVDNPRNFYPRPDNAALAELMESIRANGLLEPPTVVPDTDGKYRLISGHSRMAALRLLAANRDEAVAKQFSTVLCRVLPAMTEEQELCAVIEANRQRVKSPALLTQEAERLTEMYVKRREAGEELPGRIRDRVAEAMQVNKTKLANLSAIKNGLKVPGIVARWEKQELPEAAALEIARMDIDTQYRLLDWIVDHSRTWSINNVREFRTCWTCCKHNCPDTGGFCPNAARMYADHYRNGEWRCAGCCRECLNKKTCSSACRFVVEERFAGGIAPPPQKTPTNPAVGDPRLKNMTPKFCERVKALREATGLTRKEFAESIGEYPGTYSAWENNSLAGAGSLPKLALTLGTTMDYLCGLTDDPLPPRDEWRGGVDLAAPEWLPLDAEHWPEEGALVVLSYPTGLGGSAYLTARCCGGADDQYPFISTDAGITVQDIVECKCDSWLLISERQRGENK
jgi:ParB-like chromosome segregation protein Spo0J/transcriptional regulator with XRE-family HTH domain|nr:MAG TPA: chromosome partitioning protein [Caudoviricetes sp.]